MPKVTLNYSDEASIPDSLKAFKVADKNEVEVWVGDKVAEETNVGLAANRDSFKEEKEKLQAKYDTDKKQWDSTNDTLSKEVIDLRTKVATTSGVTADEMALLGVVKPLGLKPDDLKKRIEDGGNASQKVTALERKIQTQEIGRILGWKPEVIEDLLAHPEKSKNIAFVIEDVTENDQTVPKVFVNVTANGATEKKDVEAFLKANTAWANYLPSLKTETAETGPTWLQQRKPNDDPAKPENLVAKHIETQNQTAKTFRNPLLPNAPPPVEPAAAGK